MYSAAGTISWIPYNESTNINSLIIGGKVGGITIYVCRALVQYNNGVSLVPGWLDTVGGSCHVEIGELDIYIKYYLRSNYHEIQPITLYVAGGYTFERTTNVEVLTKNPLGQLQGVTQSE